MYVYILTLYAKYEDMLKYIYKYYFDKILAIEMYINPY